MKLLLAISLFILSLFSQDSYFLPDEYDDTIHHLTKKINNAEKSIFILTDNFNHYKIKKSLIKAAKRGVHIKLISAHNDEKKQLELYKNIKTYLLKPIQSPLLDGKIAITLIIIDNKIICKLSTALETAQMKHNIDIFTCKDDKEFIDKTDHTLTILMKRSKAYLEN